MCTERLVSDSITTIFYTFILLIPGYFIVKLIISFYFGNLKEIIIYSLICSIYFVIHHIFDLSVDYHQFKGHVFYLKH